MDKEGHQIQARIVLALSAQECPVRSVSGGLEALLGFSADQFLSGSARLQDRVHADDRVLFTGLLSPSAGPAAGSANLRLRSAAGRVVCVKADYQRRTNDDGQVLLDLLLHDARTLTYPGDALLATNFRNLIEHSQEYICLKNRHHVILAASPAMIQLTTSARTASEMAGNTDYDLYPENVADSSYRLEQQALAEKRLAEEVRQRTTQDGRGIWIDDRKYPLDDAQGAVVGLLSIAPEVTMYFVPAARIRESEAALREAQKIAHLGSFELDLHSKTWRFSPELNRIVGAEPGDGRTFEEFWALIHPEERADMSARLDGILQGKEREFEREYRIIRENDGAVRWVHTRGRVEQDVAGNPARVRGTVQDITEKKKAEAELRESKELLQLFIDHAPASLAMFDREMHYLAVSPRWIETFSFQDKEILGHSAYEISPDLPELWKEHHRRALAGETIPLHEALFLRANGNRRWVRREVRPWFTGEGQVGGVVILTEDITERKQAEAELRESKEIFQLFIEQAPAALAMLDREMRYLAVSQRWIEMHELEGRELIGRSHYEIFPDLPEDWIARHRRALAGEPIPMEEGRFPWKGKVQWARRTVLPWRNAEGQIGGIVIFTEDITIKRQAEERMRLAASVFNHASEGITITDPKGTILEVNEAFTQITGYTREEAAGKNPRILQSGLQSREFYENMWRSLVENGRWSGEIWNRNKGGEIFAEEMVITAIRDAEGNTQNYVAHFTDVTRQKEQARELERMAQYDALTGLPNRLLLRDRLQQAMAHARRSNQSLAVAYFDLDGFGTINDEYGQETGDRMLAALAQRLKRALREGDTLAKLGGDEFVAVLLDLPRNEDALPVMNRLLRAAARQVHIGTEVLRVSASIGVAFYSGSAETDGDGLLSDARQALQQAKTNGKNRYHILDPVQDMANRGHFESLQGIRQALHRHEFVLYYQPQVNMRTGKLAGVEALVRWQHPRRGLLAPDAFLPVIENHPLLAELDRWAIDHALTQIEAWQDDGLEIPVSVNVSAQELQQADFVDWLRRRLAVHSRVKPSMLQLEVLETTALQDLARTSEVLEACRQMGVSFALDDFGTGYSSLTYLKHLPTKVLKIDQSFVRDMVEEPESLGILEAVLALATAFRREVVAEGVETVEHGVMLLQLGCEVAQGYGVARPMPPHDLPGWLARWRPDPRWVATPEVRSGNRSLLYSSVEHRAWLGAFESYLQGKRHAPPLLNPTGCRFGSWLENERQAGRDHFPAFQAIETLHHQLHQLALEILDLQSDGHISLSLSRLEALHGLRDKFLERLTALN